jgi:tripartite ATP-independent transporter DctP family solute receptor
MLTRKIGRRTVLAGMGAGAVALGSSRLWAAEKHVLRISTPAVPEDWHAKMLTVFKNELEKSAPGQFDVQIFLSSTLFKQGTEPAAMARGNLEMAMISMQDIAKQIPAYSLFTAGYLIRDPEHQQKVYNGPIGAEIYKNVAEKMDIQILNVGYLGTRQLNLREKRKVMVPADLAGVRLRMPGSKEWLFLGQALGANPTPLAFGEVYLALKTGTIDAQDNPLPTVKSAKFYEVTKQITLTSHLVDGIFLSISTKAWKALNKTQQDKVKAASLAAVKYNNENRVKEEHSLVEFFKGQGLAVTTPDVAAFRKHVQEAYLKSEFSKDWPPGMLDRVNKTA